MKVVVTGAAGHVGANLVRALLTRGRSVRALVHLDRRALEGLDIEIVKADVRDLGSLLDAFTGAKVVYHLAAQISIFKDEWPLLEQVNVIGTRNVVEACLRCKVGRLIHFSSIHSQAGEADTPPYDRSKAAAEEEVRKGIKRGLDSVIIVPTAIVGPYDYKPSYFGEALLRLANGKLPALVAGGFDWVDVRDVVWGAMRAEEQAPTGSRYVLSGHWVSLREVGKLVEEITGVPAPPFVSPIWLARIGAPFVTAFDRLNGRRPLYTSVSLRALSSNQRISHQKATRELGYHPRPFRETLIDTLRWFQKDGRLTHPLKLAKD